MPHLYCSSGLCICVDIDSWQWQAISIGQASCSSEGEGEQGAYLLTDGTNVGHTRRVHATEALSLPGQHIFTCVHVYNYVQILDYTN